MLLLLHKRAVLLVFLCSDKFVWHLLNRFFEPVFDPPRVQMDSRATVWATMVISLKLTSKT